jgi:dTDP-4-amino-4,6-dideoxygalactose transaminase
MVSTAISEVALPASDPIKPVRSSEEFLIFGAPLICDEEEREILGSLRSGWLGTGPKVAQLEREFRDYKGAPYAVAVNSCTAASACWRRASARETKSLRRLSPSVRP